MKLKKSLWFILAMLLVASLVLAACQPQETATPEPQQPEATEEMEETEHS